MFECEVLRLGVCAQVSSFPLSLMFGMCSGFLFLAAACQKRLENLTSGPVYTVVANAGDTQ